jgi:chorismate mutase/prephenate dehydratase
VVDQFGSQVEMLAKDHLEDVFLATERGECQFGVIPVENTIEGAINPTFDALMESEVTICGEVLVPIAQNLLSRSGKLEDVRVVASIPQAMAQCRRWLHERLPGVELRETSSTAAAARLAAGEAGVAAIASATAAAAYGLEFVARHIEDRRGNATRFVVIGRDAPARSGNDLTSAAFTVRRDQAGALHQLLEPFARHGVNLTAVQSRPMKGKPWEYVFFIDMEGHEADEAVGRALDEAARTAHSHKILGSYPRAAKGAPRPLGQRRSS